MRITHLEPEFVFICAKYGVISQFAWKLFEHIQTKDGYLSEYEVRLYLGIGENNAEKLIRDLVREHYAKEDTTSDKNGKKYVPKISDEDIDLLAEVELGIRKPLWQ